MPSRASTVRARAPGARVRRRRLRARPTQSSTAAIAPRVSRSSASRSRTSASRRVAPAPRSGAAAAAASGPAGPRRPAAGRRSTRGRRGSARRAAPAARAIGSTPARAQLGDQHQVAARLAHLLAVQPDHPGVDVVAGERCCAGQRLGVRGRVLVVREDQVRAAALHVEAHAQTVVSAMTLHSMCQPGRPGRAGCPRTARRPGCPRHSSESSGSRLPARSGSPPRSANSASMVVAVVVRLAAEPGRRGDREVDVLVDAVGRAGGRAAAPIASVISRDRLDGADVVVRRQHPQRRHVLAEQLDLALGQLDPVLAGLRGPLEQRVVDVGDVLHVVHLVPGVAPDAVDEVEGEVGGRVAEVRRVVRRDAAHVHAGRRGPAPSAAPRRWRCRTAAARPPRPGRSGTRVPARSAWACTLSGHSSDHHERLPRQ